MPGEYVLRNSVTSAIVATSTAFPADLDFPCFDEQGNELYWAYETYEAREVPEDQVCPHCGADLFCGICTNGACTYTDH